MTSGKILRNDPKDFFGSPKGIIYHNLVMFQIRSSEDVSK